jgi:murein DD-endopeptidase MepM/ murein hydrolase activator NlpD
MTGSRLLASMVTAILLPAFALAQKQDTASSVQLTPETVVAGSPELIRVSAPGASHVSGEWLGRNVQFFQGKHPGEWMALAGVDVDAPIGPSTLKIHVTALPGSSDFSRTINIHAAHYRTESLGVQPKFVEPGPEALKQIHEQSEVKAKVFASSAPEPLWHGDFHAPVAAAATDSFGVRRMFNGKLASIHKGADFRAHMGTPVHASNSGVVVLARPLYFEGNCVVIDHGMGLFTESMHFSRIDVKEGQHVNTGDILGLSGATGRVTGPHLHWAVRWQGAFLDPIKLLKLDLQGGSTAANPAASRPRHHRRR